MIEVYVWTPPDTLTEHALNPDGDEQGQTLCGIRWVDLPDNEFTGEDGSKVVEPGDKPWYGDHDRDDVIRCVAGCFGSTSR